MSDVVDTVVDTDNDQADVSDVVLDDATTEGAAVGDDDAAEVNEGEFGEIRAHYEQGLELTDDEVDKIADLAIEYVRGILSFFGEEHIDIDEYEGDDGELILDVTNGDLAVLIGRHGRTLDSIQTVVHSLLSNTMKFHYPIVVDIEGYKSRRKEKLCKMARNAASRAKRNHGRSSLSPMSAYERRICHLALVDDPEVTTHSEGEEPDRRVVVTYVSS